MSYPNEDEIVAARLALPDAQRALLGIAAAASSEVSRALYSCAWYGTTVSDERGAFAVVQADTDLEELVGDVLRLTSGGRSTVVYIAEAVAPDFFPYDIGITRRAFANLAILPTDSIMVRYEVLS